MQKVLEKVKKGPGKSWNLSKSFWRETGISSLEVCMLDDSFILACLKGIFVSKTENFALAKICTCKKSLT